MKWYWILFGALFFGAIMSGKAQSTRDVTTIKTPAPHYQSKKKEEKFLFFFKKKQKFDRVTGEEQTEAFEKRMKKTARKRWKVEKEASRPEYSDPEYFGHKKPPKKRKPGKKKFCKECGLVH